MTHVLHPSVAGACLLGELGAAAEAAARTAVIAGAPSERIFQNLGDRPADLLHRQMNMTAERSVGAVRTGHKADPRLSRTTTTGGIILRGEGKDASMRSPTPSSLGQARVIPGTIVVSDSEDERRVTKECAATTALLSYWLKKRGWIL